MMTLINFPPAASFVSRNMLKTDCGKQTAALRPDEVVAHVFLRTDTGVSECARIVKRFFQITVT